MDDSVLGELSYVDLLQPGFLFAFVDDRETPSQGGTMAIDSRDLFAFAQSLSRNTSEVATRDAISGAYYAAFHRCRAWEQALPALGSNEGPSGGSHQELINRLKHPPSGAVSFSESDRGSMARSWRLNAGGDSWQTTSWKRMCCQRSCMISWRKCEI